MAGQVRAFASCVSIRREYVLRCITCVTSVITQVTDPIDDVVASMSKLTTQWFPHDVELVKCYVYAQETIDCMVDQAYYLLGTDQSIPHEHRLEYKKQDLLYISEVLKEYVYEFESYGGEHMREVMSTKPQLSMDMMVDYLSVAYSRELADKAGGVSPAMCAKQLKLAVPVRTRLSTVGPE